MGGAGCAIHAVRFEPSITDLTISSGIAASGAISIAGKTGAVTSQRVGAILALITRSILQAKASLAGQTGAIGSHT